MKKKSAKNGDAMHTGLASVFEQQAQADLNKVRETWDLVKPKVLQDIGKVVLVSTVEEIDQPIEPFKKLWDEASN